MFKAVIADDEPKVCQLIHKLVNWQELGIDISGIAHNGIDAFELICSHKPEIVITDIRMPGLDGLDIIKKVRESGIDSRFIIISGYRHFEYAQNALKYNVEDYLLKPIKKTELNGVLEKICSNLKADNSRNIIEAEIKNQLLSNRDSLHRHFISSIMLKQNDLKEINMNDVNREYQLNFSEGIFQAFFIKIDSPKENMAIPGADKIFDKISEISKKILSEKCNEVIIKANTSEVIGLVNYSQDCADIVKKSIKLLFDEVKNYLDFFGCFDLTLGVGSIQYEMSNIYKSLKDSIDAVKYRIVLGTDRVIWSGGLKFKGMEICNILNPEKERQLINTIEALDMDGFKSLLSDIFSYFRNHSDINPCLAFDICEKIGDIFIQTMQKTGISEDMEKSFKNSISTKLSQARSLNEIHDLTYETLSGFFDKQLQEKRMQDYKPIRMAKQYINERYMEQIRLDDMAELVHLNPAYFSTIFKKETGLNFSDYLISYRIDIAKELLKSTNLSIAEIALKIGYSETKYFSKLFNKVVGIKPSQYRKLYS